MTERHWHDNGAGSAGETRAFDFAAPYPVEDTLARATGEGYGESSGMPRRAAMPPPSAPRAALAAVGLLVLLGCWLVAAPFLTGTQRHGTRWSAATRVDVSVGFAMVGSCLAGLFGYAAIASRWLSRHAPRRVS
jgi:hypothetical protein